MVTAGIIELNLEDEEEVEEGDNNEVLEESLVVGDETLAKDEVLQESLVGNGKRRTGIRLLPCM